MANNFAVQPWYMDSASSQIPSDTNFKRVMLRGVTFRGYTTSGDKAVIKANGSTGPVIIELIGTGDLAPVTWATTQELGYVTQPYLSQLDSGNILIFTD